MRTTSTLFANAVGGLLKQSAQLGETRCQTNSINYRIANTRLIAAKYTPTQMPPSMKKPGAYEHCFVCTVRVALVAGELLRLESTIPRTGWIRTHGSSSIVMTVRQPARWSVFSVPFVYHEPDKARRRFCHLRCALDRYHSIG